MQKKRYVPDLGALMAECEANYARLMKLLPDMEAQPQRAFGISAAGRASVRVCLEVIEQFKYTATLRFRQEQRAPLVEGPELWIRIYHDARMAEVVEPGDPRQLRGVYPYPNQKMYQPDEKAQRNLYLGEWLRQCLAQGHALDAVEFARAL